MVSICRDDDDLHTTHIHDDFVGGVLLDLYHLLLLPLEGVVVALLLLVFGWRFIEITILEGSIELTFHGLHLSR